MEDKEITLSVDCYQCGTKHVFPFRLFVQHTEYSYCYDCQEGIQVFFDGQTLHIDRLEEE